MSVLSSLPHYRPSLANAVAAAINGDAKLIAANIHATHAGPNIVTIAEPGAIATLTVVSDTITAGSTITAALNPNTGHLAGTPGSVTKLDNVNNTISGAGTIGDVTDANLTLLNGPAGIINASGTKALTIATENVVTNAGIMEATKTGGLVIKDVVDNLGVGTIQAIGAGSHVDIVGGTIEGGKLFTLTGGQIDTVAGSSGTLDGMTDGAIRNLGQITVANNSTLLVDGTIHNAGTFLVNGLANATQLQIINDTTFDGGGKITLAASVKNAITESGGSFTFENVNNIISGAGTIGGGGLILQNDKAGIINATATTALIISADPSSSNAGIIESSGTGVLTIQSDLINTGFIEATGKGVMVLNGPVIDNTNGTVGAMTTGTRIDVGTIAAGGSAEIDTGTVTIVAGAKLDTLTVAANVPSPTSLTIDSATINNAGSVVAADNSSITLSDDTINNSGLISVAAAAKATTLEIGGSTVLQGGGKVTLTDNILNAITADGNPAALENVNNVISGAGTIGDSDLTLTNDVAGIINASGTKALNIATTGNDFVNSGLVESTGTGGMTISSLLMNNAPGVVAALGTGALTLSGGGTNSGIIESGGTAGSLKITASLTDDGLIESLKGTVLIQNATIDGGGEIAAIGLGSHVDLSTATILTDGMSTLAGAKIDTIASTINAIDADINNAGSFVVTDKSTLTLESSVINSGTFSLSAVTGTTTLDVANSVEFFGHGLVTLTDSTKNIIQSDGNTATLENFDNTITGAGFLGNGDVNLTLQNDFAGIINANGKNALVIDTGATSVKNDGIMEAGSTGGLTLESNVTNTGFLIALATAPVVLDDITVTNTGAVVEATGSGGHIDLEQGAFIDGGTVSTVVGSKINTTAGDTGSSGDTIDATVINAGSIVLVDNSQLTLGGLVHNTGTIALNAIAGAGTPDTVLQILDTDAVTLQGSGFVTLTDSLGNAIFSDGNPVTLTNIDNTISGAGLIGDSDLTLVNGGLINANGKINALTLDTGSNTISNTGTIELTGTGGLNIDSDVDNTGGVILTNVKSVGPLMIADAEIDDGTVQAMLPGSVIQLNDGDIVGAAVSTVVGSSITTTANTENSIIDGSVNNAGTITIVNNSALLLGGEAITNSGTIALNGSNAETDLEISDDLTLLGHGKLTMTSNINNVVESIQNAGDVAPLRRIALQIAASDIRRRRHDFADVHQRRYPVLGDRGIRHYTVTAADVTAGDRMHRRKPGRSDQHRLGACRRQHQRVNGRNGYNHTQRAGTVRQDTTLIMPGSTGAAVTRLRETAELQV